MKPISDKEVERSIEMWAEVTILSLELKYAMLRKRDPKLNEDELKELIRKEISRLKDVNDKR